jgi:hypothetical protein
MKRLTLVDFKADSLRARGARHQKASGRNKEGAFSDEAAHVRNSRYHGPKITRRSELAVNASYRFIHDPQIALASYYNVYNTRVIKCAYFTQAGHPKNGSLNFVFNFLHAP